ncbi:MAG: TetR/AcrR family transcriptional regulator [bacterium]|nr:TetR/AcrR family transcriptional regulator [bacterium]
MPEDPPHQTSRRPGRPLGRQRGEGREALLKAARQLMAEDGIPNLTSKAVATLAGVKPTLVNYYFGDRNGLLRAVVEQAASNVAERTRVATDSIAKAEDRLVQVMAGLLRACAEAPYAPRLLFEQVVFADDDVIDRFAEQFGREHLDAIRALLEDGQRRGEFRRVDLEMAIAAIGGICIFFAAASPLLQRLMNLEPLTLHNVDAMARRAADLVLHGLARTGAEPA